MEEQYEAMQQQMAELKEDLLKLRNDFGGVLRTMMDATKTTAEDTRDRLQSKAREQLDEINARFDATRNRGRFMADQFAEQIEEHPMASILTAMGAGLVLGMLMSRK